MAMISAVTPRWILLDSLIEPPLAGHIMVDAEDVGDTSLTDGARDVVRRNSRLQREVVHRMPGSDASRQQIKRQPPSFVLERRLMRQCPRGMSAPEVFRLHQDGARIYRPNRGHRKPDRANLIQRRTPEFRIATGVRIP